MSIIFRDTHQVRVHLSGDAHERETWDLYSCLIERTLMRLKARIPKHDPKYGHLLLSDDTDFPMTVTCCAEATDYGAPAFCRKKEDVGGPWKFSDILRRLFDALDAFLSVRENNVSYDISHAIPEKLPIRIYWSTCGRGTLKLLNLRSRDDVGEVQLECLDTLKPRLRILACSTEVLALSDVMERFRRTERWYFSDNSYYCLGRKTNEFIWPPPHHESSCGYSDANGEKWLMTDWQWCEARARLERIIRGLVTTP